MDKDQFIVYSTAVQDVIHFSGHPVLGQVKERAILEAVINLHMCYRFPVLSLCFENNGCAVLT